LACENWNKKHKKNNSYLEPNPHLRHVNLKKSKIVRILPLLKNGSRATELKACSVNQIGKVVLMITCAFDTIASIFLVAYCDSQLHYNKIYIILDSSTFFSFIFKIVKYGITASKYS
jgi:hypothetical protein